MWVVEIFKKMPAFVPQSNNPRGRPLLNLTGAQRTDRRTLLKKLNAQVRYYIKEGHLDLSRPVYLSGVTFKDVRKATRFRDNLDNILNSLGEVGGIPKKYKGYLSEPEDEEKVV